eukprot:COSAG05_NODE_484_length_9355_cov_5.704840_2_plen_148_part_00
MPLVLGDAPEPESEQLEVIEGNDKHKNSRKNKKQKKKQTYTSSAAGAFEAEPEEPHHRKGCGAVLQSLTSQILLYLFNLAAFFSCAIIVAGQIAAWEEFDVSSPELVVLGATIAALAVVSLIGLHGTWKKKQHKLRMCVASSVQFNL